MLVCAVLIVIHALDEERVNDVGTVEYRRNDEIISKTDVSGIEGIGLSVNGFAELVFLTRIMRAFASIYCRQVSL